MDDDREYPTICGTGTEDYFCGSYNFENPQTHQYQTFTTPYSGLCQVIRPDGVYASQTRFGLYRWHIADPVSLRRNSASRFRHWAGAAAGVICHYRTISRRSPISTLIGLPARFRPLGSPDELEII